MIKYLKHTLKNGLKIFLCPIKNSNIANINIMYDVGSRDEEEHYTGFAHLFEHLMFGGSKNIKSFDTELQKVGGINNAYTSSDITNYYNTLPVENLETALWLESDRMLELAFNQNSLDVQKKVVIEEFKEHYHNPPYGELWPTLCSLSYKKHPYKWATIGKDINHIEKADLEYVKKFFYQYYAPNNAILSIVGGINPDATLKLIEKYFSGIDKRKIKSRKLVNEPTQTKSRFKTIIKDVPLNAIYKTFHITERKTKSYYAFELLSDIFSMGKSSLFYQNLVKDKNLFVSIDSYTTGTFDKGLLIVGGKINKDVDPQIAEKELDDIIFKLDNLDKNQLIRVKNQTNLEIETSYTDVGNIAHDLCYFELMGDIDLIKNEKAKYDEIELNYILGEAKKAIVPNKQNTLYYKKK